MIILCGPEHLRVLGDRRICCAGPSIIIHQVSTLFLFFSGLAPPKISYFRRGQTEIRRRGDERKSNGNVRLIQYIIRHLTHPVYYKALAL